jgi:phage regulator Rha-like protein
METQIKLFDNPRMTSLQIAEVTGKPHNDVLKAIRNMETAWEKVTGRKFPPSEYTDSTGRKRPMYELSKEECLYIATKFNDEARAKLVLRWAQLETEKAKAMPQIEISRYTANLIECLQMYDALFDRFYSTLFDRYGERSADEVVNDLCAKRIAGFRSVIEEYLTCSFKRFRELIRTNG